MATSVSFILRTLDHIFMSEKAYDKQKHDARNDKKNSIFLYFLTFWCAMSIISISDPCHAQKAVEQKTTGDKSPNLYAPQAKMISVTYGVSEKLVNELIEQLQGKDKVIESLLEDLKGKNATLKVMETQIQEWTMIAKGLNKQLAETTSSKKITPLIEFTPYDFVDNFIAFGAYIRYRKTLELLNPDMLIELLNVYFRSVLLYPSISKKEYYITARNGELLRLQIQGHNKKGEIISISLPDISASLLADVCTDFIKSADSKHYEMIENLFDCALSTPQLDKIHKINILDAKNFIQKNKLLLNM